MGNNKNNEAKDTAEAIEKLCPMSDTLLQKLMLHEDFCQELLQVVMEDDTIELNDTVGQYSLHNIDTRSSILDAKFTDKKKTIYGIEVENSYNYNLPLRVRFESSCLNVQSLAKRNSFNNLPKLCMITISRSDIFKLGDVKYIVERTLRGKNITTDNGYYEIYVNTKIKDSSDLSEYMQMFKSIRTYDNPKFPALCKWVKYYKVGEGREVMCKVLEEFAEKRVKEANDKKDKVIAKKDETIATLTAENESKDALIAELKAQLAKSGN